MPSLSNRLYNVGIVIYMYFQETQGQGKHHLPHIHVAYKDMEVVYDFVNMEIIEGDNLKPQIKKILTKWIEDHQDELLEMWNTGDIKRLD